MPVLNIPVVVVRISQNRIMSDENGTLHICIRTVNHSFFSAATRSHKNASRNEQRVQQFVPLQGKVHATEYV